MKMKFPLVTRGRFDDTVAQLKEAKAALAEMARKYELLNNQFVFRATGMALDPELLPQPYRPKARAAEEAANPLADPPEKPGGIKLVRHQLRQVEEARMQKFAKEMAKRVSPGEVARAIESNTQDSKGA